MTDTSVNAGGNKAEDQPGWAKSLADSMKEIGEGLKTIVGIAKNPPPPIAQPQPQPQPDDESQGDDILADNQLELLPRKDFARRLLEAFDERMESHLKPISDKIIEQGRNLLTSNYQRDAEKFFEKTPDAHEWGDEMVKVAQQSPELPVARIYAIVRAENPTKTAEMQEKYYKKLDTNTQNGQKKSPLSLSPSSNDTSTKNQKMGVDEAAKAAWEESVAKFGDIFKT
jgi:hypothetical protein